jgi:hypothetical protein
MSEDPREGDRSPLRRVAVIVRSWDGPNSRIGLEMDLTQMPWGPFDALGKRLNLVLPSEPGPGTSSTATDSEIDRALRHVEHAADRCGEFAKLGKENQELWLRSQETWEWVRRHLTAHWLEKEVDRKVPLGSESEAASVPPADSRVVPEAEPPLAPGSNPGKNVAEELGDGAPVSLDPVQFPALPGAASTLLAVARALRATPLSAWKEAMGTEEEATPTREEAIQTLLGVARVLNAGGSGEKEPLRSLEPQREPEESGSEEPDPDRVSFDFASGYDDGYQMGRRVGLALGMRKGTRKIKS